MKLMNQIVVSIVISVAQASIKHSIITSFPLSSSSPQLDHGGHSSVAEGVSGAAAVREELPGLPGHREHLTSVSATHRCFV